MRHLTARLLVLVLLGAGPVGVPPAEATTEPDPVGSARADTITLVTGDRVVVEKTREGQWSATVLPADPSTTFQTVAVGDDFYVIPDSAAPLVPDRLDRELFNVAEMVRRDLHDEAAPDLPLLVEHEEGEEPSIPAARETTDFDSIEGAAASVRKDRAERLGRAIGRSADPETPDPLAGVEKIWLDPEVTVALDRSVTQIGADEAHTQGIDGAGVSVAVLDTGIDDSHPDLDGKVTAERNFTTSPSASDAFGHGTHVASIIAGSGAASDGAFRGVAPGATLLNGKVLGDGGSGLASWVIGGMEWAVEQGADVVNMSLGGAPTDGTDPLSRAVNSLTADSGALFVVAAGNNGPFTRTIGSPGAADAALTVGAVSRADTLASFSSRGPRLGDFAIKPDLTAPGMGIVAARADGTSMGDPVDERYTSASGTSMAAPHTAGAAALLLQSDPSWDADELKPALVTSGVPRSTNTVYEQGGGRASVSRAIEDPVRAAPAPLDLGFFPWPHGGRDPVTTTVTFTNPKDEPVTLDLELEVTNEDGQAPAAGMVAVEPESVTLPPGEAAEVAVTLDPDVGDTGTYGGYLIGRENGEVEVRVPVGFTKEPERYDLTVHGISRDGLPAGGLERASVVNVDDAQEFFQDRLFIDGTAIFRVPPGTYSVLGSFRTSEGTRLRQLFWVTEPEFEVSADTEVALDARDANPIQVSVSGHATVGRQIKMNQYRESVAGSSVHLGHVIGFEVEVFASPTAPVTEGEFEFNSQFRLLAPDSDGQPSPASPYLFDLIFPKPDAIPPNLDEVVDPEGLARIDTGYAVQGEVRDYDMDTRAAWRPWQFFNFDLGFPATGARVRTEYISPGDTRWRQQACPRFLNFVEPFLCLTEPQTQYTGDERLTRSWSAQPGRPGVAAAGRTGRFLSVSLNPVIDGQGHRASSIGSFAGGFSQQLRLYEDGSLVAEQSSPDVSVFAADERRRFRLEYETAMAASWANMSTETRIAWEFDSGPERSGLPILDSTSGFEEVPSLLLLDYDIDGLDLRNRASFPSGVNDLFSLGLRVGHLDGAEAAPVDEARLWVSYDDGSSWEEANLQPAGDGEFRADLSHRAFEETNGFVALRVEVRDTDGNMVEQEIVRAYGLTPPYVQRVNAGADAYIDGAGESWAADQTYSSGEWGYTNPGAGIQTTNRDIAGTEDDPLYQAVRVAPQSYRFDVPDGMYAVTLRFAEPTNRAPGTRAFDVVAEGEVVLEAYDIAAAVGTRTADDHVFTVRVDDGTLDLDFLRRSGAHPAIAAIAVVQTAD